MNISRTICGATLFLSFVAFSPLVIPVGIFEPLFIGLPYTLWVGFLVSFGMLLLIIAGAISFPSEEKGENR